MTFKDKVVAITGAAGGVGQSLCRFSSTRARRSPRSTRKRASKSLAAELNADAKRFAHAVADISDPQEVERAFASLTGALGPVDILVNNAGGSAHRTLARTDPAGWRQDIKGNLDSAYYCAHAVIPGMLAKRSGVIINIGSVNGLSALGDPAYSAAKAAMISLTRSLAQEYGPYGVRANIVLPGTVRTPLWEKRAAKDPEGPGNAAALVPSRTRRRACRYRESRRFPGVRRGLGDHRRGSAGGLRVNVGQYPDEKGSDARRPLTAIRCLVEASSASAFKVAEGVSHRHPSRRNPPTSGLPSLRLRLRELHFH